MLDFMVISLPRSGSTWASNWLTTDKVFCKHDPLYSMHYTEFDEKLSVPGTLNGISCTGIWRWVDWVNRHPAKKLILRRDLKDINKSMNEIGLRSLDKFDEIALMQVGGWHVNFSDLFDTDKAEIIWKYLTGTEFNARRHQELVDIEMQPKFSGLKVNKEATRKLMAELHEAYSGE